MVERKKIGLRFSYNDKWIAGAYYIINIIHALNTLEDNEKPILILLADSKDNFDAVQNETNYPYLEFIQFPVIAKEYTIIERVINKISRILIHKNLIVNKPVYPILDFLYPTVINDISTNLKKVNWIPDFQEDHLPHFFSNEEIIKRKARQTKLAEDSDVIVLSSYDAECDFKRLYPNAKSATFVLQFAVTHPDFSNENIEENLKNYNLPTTYFFAPNQFWAHKNHIVILKAIKLLKEKGINITVAMSGKEYDNRNLDNFKNIKDYISQNQLENNIIFLGFLPRKVQLCLMKNSLAIIQPSLFEGWSTVVEDAKALNKYIILSNINVHKEQIHQNVSFFNPHQPEALATILENYQLNTPPFIPTKYSDNVRSFGKRFMELVNQKY